MCAGIETRRVRFEVALIEITVERVSPKDRDPCRFNRQVNQIGELTFCTHNTARDPCRLVRQVNEFEQLKMRHRQKSQLSQSHRLRR